MSPSGAVTARQQRSPEALSGVLNGTDDDLRRTARTGDEATYARALASAGEAAPSSGAGNRAGEQDQSGGTSMSTAVGEADAVERPLLPTLSAQFKAGGFAFSFTVSFADGNW